MTGSFRNSCDVLPQHQYGTHQLSFSEMEAQLQEQQSRDKEIKAVNETVQVSLNLKFLCHPDCIAW